MHETIAVDAIDLRLLAALQDDGRLTNQQAGEMVGLSASQCSRRRSALEAAGLIRGYRAVLAAEPLGLQILAFIEVTLNAHSGDNARRFRDLVARVDAVQEAYAVTGSADYLVKAVVPDLRGLSALVNDVLLGNGSVARVRSSIVLERLKETGRLPIAPTRRGPLSPAAAPATG